MGCRGSRPPALSKVYRQVAARRSSVARQPNKYDAALRETCVPRGGGTRSPPNPTHPGGHASAAVCKRLNLGRRGHPRPRSGNPARTAVRGWRPRPQPLDRHLPLCEDQARVVGLAHRLLRVRHRRSDDAVQTAARSLSNETLASHRPRSSDGQLQAQGAANRRCRHRMGPL